MRINSFGQSPEIPVAEKNSTELYKYVTFIHVLIVSVTVRNHEAVQKTRLFYHRLCHF